MTTNFVSSYPNHRRRKHRRRLLQSSRPSDNLLDVYRNETTGSLEARCHLAGLLPVNPDRPEFVLENYLAIQLAVKHLNEGNGGLVPEILGLNKTCPISFSASITDTQWRPTWAFQAVDELTEMTAVTAAAKNMRRPCAFVGAVSSAVSKSTALVTGLRGFPQVSQASTDLDLSEKDDYPLFARTVPDDGFMAEAFVRFLYDTLQVRHLFIIAELSAFPKSVLKSIREAILRLGWSPGINATTESNDPKPDVLYVEERLIDTFYPDIHDSEAFYGDFLLKGSVFEAIEALKASEFRFVLALTTDTDNSVRLMEVAQNRGVAGDGNHHWWFYETLNLEGFQPEIDLNVTKAIDGVGYIYQTSIKEGNVYEQFVQDSQQLKQELYQNRPNNETVGPTASDWLFSPGLGFTEPLRNESEWFNNGYSFEKGLYAYDATVLLGLSACREVAPLIANISVDTENATDSLVLTGKNFFERIRRTNFTGVTGSVILDPLTGTRDGNSVQYAIDNIRVVFGNKNSDGSNKTVRFDHVTTYVFKPGGNVEWHNVNPYIFNGEKTLTALGPHPDLPTVEIRYKHVNAWLPVVAIGLLVIILAATMSFAIWTYKHWNSRVVKASQPHFLLLACLGIGIMTLAIVPLSREHTEVRMEENIWFDRVCISTWWFAFIGFGITFSTLFAKTKRINKILTDSIRCKRIQVSMRETMYPVVIISCFNIIMLSLMTKFGSMKYEVKATKEDKFGRSVEKYGNCNYGDDTLYFLMPIGVVNLGMVGLALFQAWRARYLSTEFAESKYIANALLIMVIVTFFFIPVLLLTQDDPNIDTFANIVIATVYTGIPLCFIFIPKIIFHEKSKIPLANRKSFIMSSLIGRISTPKHGRDMSDTHITGNLGSSNRVSTVSTSFIKSTPYTSHISNIVVAPTPPNFQRHANESDDVGERILTTKPQHELASEINTLQLENAAIRAEIAELQNLLLDFTSDKDFSTTDGDRTKSSTIILEDASYEFKSAALSSDDGSEYDENPFTNSESRDTSGVKDTTADDLESNTFDPVQEESAPQRVRKRQRKSLLRFSLSSPRNR